MNVKVGDHAALGALAGALVGTAAVVPVRIVTRLFGKRRSTLGWTLRIVPRTALLGAAVGGAVDTAQG
jgi:hypothetical protein